MLLFNVNGQTLKRTDHFNPATDSVEYLKAKFTFNDSAWSGKTKTALFRIGEVVYKSVLGTDGTCKVPSEVLVGGEDRVARIHGETIYVSLVAEYGTIRITTNEIAVKLNRSGFGDAKTPSDPTESEYQQMTAVAADAVAEAENARIECENARADLVGVKNIFANAIKGNLSGPVVFADDVSPVDHNQIVKVHGKNLFNYDAWKGINAIHGEVTYSDDGVVKLTATEDDCFTNYGMYPVAARIPVKVGETVTLSWETDADETLTSGMVYVFANGTADSFISAPATQKKLTYIPPSDCEFITFRVGVSSTGDSITYWNLQIENGDVATSYEPYIDPSTLVVKRYGKNLIPPHESYTQGGYTVAKNINGSVTVTGKSNTDGAIYLNLSPVTEKPFVLHKGIKYSFTWNSNNGRSGYLKLVGVDGENKWITASQGSMILNGDEYAQIVQIYTQIGASSATDPNTVGDTSLCGKYYFQLEASETATEFEKYAAPMEHIPTSDGTISGMASISPNMTILTDTNGVIVDCEYIRDSNKVIEKLTNAIIALGGTV